MSNPATTGQSRVFLIEGRARPDHLPDFQDCVVAGAPEQDFGESEKIECPDPTRFDGFVETGEVAGEISRPSMSLMGRYMRDMKSKLLELGRKRCAFDIQVNIGKCSDPRLFNAYEKTLIIEAASGGSWSADELGALASGDNAAINETLEPTGRVMYEVLPVPLVEVAGDAVTNPVNDVIVCSTVSCGDCDDQDGGCDRVYAVGASTPGSPGTSPDIVYSLNVAGVRTWYGTDINTIAVGDEANGVACLGQYVIVVSDDEGSIHYILKSDLDQSPPAAGWTEVTTGFVGANYPVDVWSVGDYAFIVGLNGYIYGTADPTGGVAVLDAGVATTNDLHMVKALDSEFAVAVGSSGTIVKTENQDQWAVVAGPSGVADAFTAVAVKNKKEWLIGSDAGAMYYTNDGGTTWTTKTLPVTSGVTYSQISDIVFSTDSVVYASALLSSTKGRILKSKDGGYSWIILPENGTQDTPASDEIRALAACPNNANFVVGGGLADDASDGILVMGEV